MKKLMAAFVLISSVCFGEEKLEVLIAPEAIAQKICEAAAKIDEDYRDKELTILMVMKGAICLSADLIRQIHVPFTLEYIKASSYGNRGAQRGEVKIKGLEDLDLDSKNVLLVDDIYDSGQTMTAIISELQKKNPKSLKALVLLVKNVPRHTDYLPDYCLFDIENHFVVGYGLDFKERYRGLPGIYAIIQDKPSIALAH